MKTTASIAALVLIVAASVAIAYIIGKRTADKEAYIAKLQRDYAELKEQRSEVKNETSESVASVRQNRASIRTPQEAVTDINTNLGTHIGIVPSGAQGASVGDVPPVTQFHIPTSEIQRVTAAITDYKVLEVELSGCKKELDVCDKQIANLEQQLKKSKPSTLGKIGRCALQIAIPAGIGKLAGGNGWAVAGGGAGVGSCIVTW